jgi:pimeloyl-ACP methyl ester carboxylesterase
VIAMPLVSANGLQLETEAFGDARHPAVLLVMGLGMQLVAWPDEFCRAIAAAGYHVVRFDNRDVGLSSRVPANAPPNPLVEMSRYFLRLPVRAPYRIEDMAEDAVGVLDALGLPAAHIVGASMGGMIGQALAAAHPHRCLSLVSIMSTSGARRLPYATLRVGAVLARRPPRGASFEARLDHVVRVMQAIGSPGYPTPEPMLRERLAVGLRRGSDTDGMFRQLLAVLASGDRSAALATISAPTLVLHGEADPFVRVQHGIDCARKIPGAVLQTIPGMGHDFAPGLMPVLANAILSHLARAAIANVGRAAVREAAVHPLDDNGAAPPA